MATSFAEEIAQSHDEDCLEADELLRQITVDNRQPAYPEFVFFQKLGWNEKTVRDQLRRMHNVVRLQAVAGTPDDRLAAQNEADTSAEVLAKESPKLAAKIVELQSKLEGFHRDARLSEKRVADQTAAVQQLKELVPQNVSAQVNAERSVIEHSIGQILRDAEIRVNELECCLTPAKYPDEKTWLETLQRSFRDAVEDVVSNRIMVRKLSPAWPSIRVAIENELIELQAKLVDMRAEYLAAIQQAELPLDHYSDPKNMES